MENYQEIFTFAYYFLKEIQNVCICITRMPMTRDDDVHVDSIKVCAFHTGKWEWKLIIYYLKIFFKA